MQNYRIVIALVYCMCELFCHSEGRMWGRCVCERS